jgi:hypothetical protein
MNEGFGMADLSVFNGLKVHQSTYLQSSLQPLSDNSYWVYYTENPPHFRTHYKGWLTLRARRKKR